MTNLRRVLWTTQYETLTFFCNVHDYLIKSKNPSSTGDLPYSHFLSIFFYLISWNINRNHINSNIYQRI